MTKNYEYLEESLASMVQSTKSIDLKIINQVVELLLKTYRSKNTVFTVGNGGSASTAAHFAADLSKFATADKPGFKALDLVSNYSAHTAWSNDTNWENTWTGMLNPWINKDDVLVLFSVHGGSGWSNNLVKAIELASSRGVKTIGFSGAEGGEFAKHCDISVVVPCPPSDLITPVTESVHVYIHHMICTALRKRLSD